MANDPAFIEAIRREIDGDMAHFSKLKKRQTRPDMKIAPEEKIAANTVAMFNPSDDGGEDANICTVKVQPRSAVDGKANACLVLLDQCFNLDVLAAGAENWQHQFVAACLVGGSLEAQEEAAPGDIILHILVFPWKILFAFIPPTDYSGGWLTFFVCLIFIGILTAVIGDFAALLGCTVGVEDQITAITFVALGTSMPDAFASKAAAVEDEYADASVGNVTGSNSVNVFLGLGMPWTIACIYWQYIAPEAPIDFEVIGGSLAFSVNVYVVCALMCLFILYIRRRNFGGELGGPTGSKVLTCVFFVCAWVYYIMLSTWRVKQAGAVPLSSEIFMITVGLLILFLAAFIFALVTQCMINKSLDSQQKLKKDDMELYLREFNETLLVCMADQRRNEAFMLQKLAEHFELPTEAPAPKVRDPRLPKLADSDDSENEDDDGDKGYTYQGLPMMRDGYGGNEKTYGVNDGGNANDGEASKGGGGRRDSGSGQPVQPMMIQVNMHQSDGETATSTGGKEESYDGGQSGGSAPPKPMSAQGGGYTSTDGDTDREGSPVAKKKPSVKVKVKAKGKSGAKAKARPTVDAEDDLADGADGDVRQRARQRSAARAGAHHGFNSTPNDGAPSEATE